MKVQISVLCVLTVSGILVGAVPKFGDRIVKEDASNSSVIDLVFRPTQTPIKTVPKENRINKSYDYSTDQNWKSGENVYKPSIEKDSISTEDQEIFEDLRSSLLPNSTQDVDQLELVFDDIPGLASSHHSDGPVPPPSPSQPQPMPGNYGYYPKQSQYLSKYEPSEEESEPKRKIKKDFALNIPQGFPQIIENRKAEIKKELMGTQNTDGKPWGTKTSYTYKDPKNPHNFMEMSEVVLSVNREMDPQEAQSQIQKFLAVAQSGQYGPMIPIKHNENYTPDNQPDHHPGASFMPPIEPIEPSEPKFMDF